MAHQERIVGRDEAARILSTAKAVIRRQEPGRFTYWSEKLGYIVMQKVQGGYYRVSWDGEADCRC